MTGFMRYMSKKSSQFLFIGFGAKLCTKVAIINRKGAVWFLLGPFLVPVRILAYNLGLACFFISADILINRKCPAGYFYRYLPQFIGSFYESGISIKFIALRKKIIKLLLT